MRGSVVVHLLLTQCDKEKNVYFGVWNHQDGTNGCSIVEKINYCGRIRVYWFLQVIPENLQYLTQRSKYGNSFCRIVLWASLDSHISTINESKNNEKEKKGVDWIGEQSNQCASTDIKFCLGWPDVSYHSDHSSLFTKSLCIWGCDRCGVDDSWGVGVTVKGTTINRKWKGSNDSESIRREKTGGGNIKRWELQVRWSSK